VPSNVASTDPSVTRYVSSNGWSCGPANPSGSYCTMNMVDIDAPRSESTIIFTVIPL
jgi:hypothetical protein